MERKSKTKAPVKDEFDIFDPRNARSDSGATKAEMKAMAKYISKNQGDDISMQDALSKVMKMSAKELKNLKRATGFSTGGRTTPKPIPKGPEGAGMRALKKKAPEVAAQMGYKNGGAVMTKTNQKPHMS